MCKSFVTTTSCLKKVPSLDCYNFETWEWVLIFFGRNVTDRVSNQRHITMPLQITCASALPGKTEKHENHIFTKMLYQCIAWIQSVVWFLQSFWLTTHTHDAVWLPKSCNQCIQPTGLLGQGSGERKLTALQQLDCVARTMHQCAVFWVSYFAR